MMKKIWCLFLAIGMVLQLCTVTFAAVSSEYDGICGISGEASLQNFRTAENTAADSTKMSDGTTTLYADACHFTVECSGVTSNKQYMLYLLTEQAVPSADNLVYIDQQAAANGKVTFDNVYPESLESGTYYVYVAGEGKSLSAPVATFQYYMVPRFTLRVSLPAMGVSAATVTRSAVSLGSGTVWSSVKVGTFTIEAEGLVSRTETIQAEDGADVTVTLAAAGDINGSGKVDVADMQCLYDYLSAEKSTGILSSNSAYYEAVADANGDGTVNILDYQYIYQDISKG